MTGRGPIRARLVMLAGTALVFVLQFQQVRATNFAGRDEWLCLDLASRGVLGTPYAKRPLDLLWTALPARAWPHDLRGYWLFHGLYLLGTGLLASVLANRVVPGRRVVPLVAGVAACVWAPLDFMRLDSVLLTRYSGCTLAVTAALLLVLDSWTTQRIWTLVLGAGLGFLAALGFEGALPLLAAAPLVPAVLGPPFGRAGWVRLMAWEGVVLLAAALTAPGALVFGGAGYQIGGLGFDPSPMHVAGRLAQLASLELGPLVTSPPAELGARAVVLAAAAFAVACAVAAWGEPPPVRPGRPALRLIALGAGLTVLGLLPFAFSPATQGAARTQILCAPGVGLLLAGLAALGEGIVPVRAGRLAAGLVGAWVVAVGSGRVVSMQADWDGISSYADQRRTLAGLVREAPGVRPGTLFVLLDDAGAWPYGFSFRHAVSYLYPGEAIGAVANASDILYPQRLSAAGVAIAPYASIRKAWDAPQSFHPWSAVVIARLPAAGPLEIAQRWPSERLPPPLPADSYSPGQRIVRGAPAPASRAVLRASVEGGS